MDWITWLFVVALVLVLVFAVWLGIQDDKEWQAFLVTQHCHPIGKVDATATPAFGITSTGKSVVTTVYTPEKIIYQCDCGMRIR